MAGQDRSMLGGMKALILVNPSITSKQPSLFTFSSLRRETFSRNVCSDVYLVRWEVMGRVFDP